MCNLVETGIFHFLYFNYQESISTFDLNPVGVNWLKGTFSEIYFIALILHYLVLIGQEKITYVRFKKISLDTCTIVHMCWNFKSLFGG
jgi:hypothetical protein